MNGILIANGELFDRDSLIREVKEDRFIICIDGGTNYAYQSGIIPDLIIGDMDSVDNKVLEYYKTLDIPSRLYPRNKDKTDFHLAIEEIERAGIRDVSIYGIVGTRIDHTLSAFGIIRRYVRERRLDLVKISIGVKADGYVFRDSIEIEGEISEIISIIPLTDKVSGVTTYNLKYPLKEAEIYWENSLTISNEIEKSPCRIEVSDGVILVAHYRSK